MPLEDYDRMAGWLASYNNPHNSVSSYAKAVVVRYARRHLPDAVPAREIEMGNPLTDKVDG